jgi:16S rRNA (cytosine967-C5)-methyltransferase
MPASPARAAAFKVLLRVQEEEAFASELLHSDLLSRLSDADRGLCTEIVMGVLRWQSALDRDIANVSGKQTKRLDPEVLIALRIAAYQIRFLDRIPARAAVNESVELVKEARKKSATGFANAVLRKLISGSQELSPAATPAQDLSQRLAHPEWMVMRWMEAFGAAAAQRICEHDQSPPVTTLRLHAASAETLREEGIETEAGALVANALRVRSGDVTKTRAYTEGRVFIQDEASQLVALLVGRGNRILDCCAAPGSKTAALAFRNPEAMIVAAEIHPHRARLLKERVCSPNLEVLTADAAMLNLGPVFDRVLADVPCSGTGTLARNPEIKWKLRREDLADLHRRQVGILASALRHVAPGGRAVFSTCSLETEENSDVVREVLGSHPEFRLVSCKDELVRLRDSGDLVWNDLDSMVRNAFLRTLPGVHPCEGFFAAIFERD